MLSTLFPFIFHNKLDFLTIGERIENLKGRNFDHQINVDIFSNATLNPLADLFKIHMGENGIDALISVGNYDNILQDALAYKDSGFVLVDFELWNYKPNFITLLQQSSDEDFATIKSEIVKYLTASLRALASAKKVYFKLLSPFPIVSFSGFEMKSKKICVEINELLMSLDFGNVEFVDGDNFLKILGFEKSFDLRAYFSSKNIFRFEYLEIFSLYVTQNIFFILNGQRKVLAVDCDNTLWRGVVGEDGLDQIEFGENSTRGAPFSSVQGMIKFLQQNGVVTSLVSKNNERDVLEVFEQRKSEVKLDTDALLFNKINWNPKVENLQKISKEMNVSLNSMVFLDDSDFEIGYAQDKLPEVLSVKVPAGGGDYLFSIVQLFSGFVKNGITKEDASRLRMYAENIDRDQEREKFNDIENYLESLDMDLNIIECPNNETARLVDLTQKTNQFNLTTSRLTESEVSNYIYDEHKTCFAFRLTDRFGELGLTGACFVSFYDDEASIDNLLMSCRVIGRQVEVQFFNQIVDELKKRGITKLNSKYVPTKKNEQVKCYYDTVGMVLFECESGERRYTLNMEQFEIRDLNYIKTNWGNK